ncbi:c-type cytochrome domain-containing protein [Deferrisoma sp.]
MRKEIVGLAAAVLLAGCQQGVSEQPPTPSKGAFGALVEEVLAPHCARPGCHTGDRPAGGLHLGDDRAYDDLVNAPAHRRPDRKRVVPGDPAASYLLDRITEGGDRPLMPLGADPLSDAEIRRIEEWIREGAPR